MWNIKDLNIFQKERNQKDKNKRLDKVVEIVRVLLIIAIILVVYCTYLINTQQFMGFSIYLALLILAPPILYGSIVGTSIFVILTFNTIMNKLNFRKSSKENSEKKSKKKEKEYLGMCTLISIFFIFMLLVSGYFVLNCLKDVRYVINPKCVQVDEYRITEDKASYKHSNSYGKYSVIFNNNEGKEVNLKIYKKTMLLFDTSSEDTVSICYYPNLNLFVNVSK